VTRDDEGAASRRARARARAGRLRAHRRGTVGLALFVGGPVLGFAGVVAGILLGMTGPQWWLLAIPGGILVGLALHRIGLRMLLSADDAREALAREGDPSAAPTPTPAPGPDASIDP
jgi:hypothetical protein